MEDSSFVSSGVESNYKSLPILNIIVSSRVYTQEDRKAIYNSIKEQVGNCYLPILVPENVNLEIIKE